MTFMPGDSKREVPQYVEVEWLVTTPNIKMLQSIRDKKFEAYKQAWMDETSRINSMTPKHIRRIDLTNKVRSCKRSAATI